MEKNVNYRSILYIILAFIAGITYRLFFLGLQGVDNVDVGFCNTFYDLFFSRPDANTFNFIYYLTGLIGALWERAFGQFGLLGFRFFEVITLSLCITVLVYLFRKMGTQWLTGAVLLSFLFPTMLITFHYDTLTYLLIVLSALGLTAAMAGKRTGFVVAGLLIGISFFARIVNLSFIALLIIPLLFSAKEKRLGNTAIMAAGISTGALLMIALIHLTGHWQYFCAAIADGLSTLGRSDATHSQGGMITAYFHSLINVALQMALIFALILFYETVIKHRPQWRKWLKPLWLIIVFVVAYTSLPYLTMLSACLVVIVYGVREGLLQTMRERAVVAFLVLATFLFPIGSDIGVQGIFNWCAGLMIFPAIWCLHNAERARRNLLCALFASLACATIVRTATGKVYGGGKHWECTKEIQPGRLNVLTNSISNTRLDEAIDAIDSLKGKDSLVLLANQQSELYYATRTVPYLGHTQTIIYQGPRLKRRLWERLAHFGQYPLIVFTEWHPEDYELRNKQIILEWMNIHDYSLVYRSNGISIYKKINIAENNSHRMKKTGKAN